MKHTKDTKFFVFFLKPKTKDLIPNISHVGHVEIVAFCFAKSQILNPKSKNIATKAQRTQRSLFLSQAPKAKGE